VVLNSNDGLKDVVLQTSGGILHRREKMYQNLQNGKKIEENWSSLAEKMYIG
jgi:hypothetical protein